MEKEPPERALDRSVEIGVLEHQHRPAAELERDRAQTLAGGGRDPRTDLGGPREEDLRDPTRADELLAGGGIPLDNSNEPRRRARLLGTRVHEYAVSGASSDGLITTELPAATAAMVCVNGIPNGKFHGVITATAP